MSQRSRTTRKITASDASGVSFEEQSQDTNNNFLKFLENKAEDAYTRPWHRLERGLRLNRLRLFAKDESERFHLTESDQTALFNLLVKALDKKLLTSKTTVIYDMAQQKILEIKGLTFHTGADGKIHFQMVERKSGVTLKKKREDEA